LEDNSETYARETERLKSIYNTISSQNINTVFKEKITEFYEGFSKQIKSLHSENKELKKMLKALYSVHMRLNSQSKSKENFSLEGQIQLNEKYKKELLRVRETMGLQIKKLEIELQNSIDEIRRCKKKEKEKMEKAYINWSNSNGMNLKTLKEDYKNQLEFERAQFELKLEQEKRRLMQSFEKERHDFLRQVENKKEHDLRALEGELKNDNRVLASVVAEKEKVIEDQKKALEEMHANLESLVRRIKLEAEERMRGEKQRWEREREDDVGKVMKKLKEKEDLLHKKGIEVEFLKEEYDKRVCELEKKIQAIVKQRDFNNSSVNRFLTKLGLQGENRRIRRSAGIQRPSDPQAQTRKIKHEEPNDRSQRQTNRARKVHKIARLRNHEPTQKVRTKNPAVGARRPRIRSSQRYPFSNSKTTSSN
jgi:hypothetical protein